MSGGLQPNSALGRKPLFPELGPYLLCQHERTFRRPAASNQLSSDIALGTRAACVSHRAFSGTTAGDVGELPFEGARSQNIENNPMQSSRRPPAPEEQLDTSGKSGAFLHHSAIL